MNEEREVLRKAGWKEGRKNGRKGGKWKRM